MKKHGQLKGKKFRKFTITCTELLSALPREMSKNMPGDEDRLRKIIG